MSYDQWLSMPPEGGKPIAKDVFGEDLYEGDFVYETIDGYVHEDELSKYIEAFIGRSFSLMKEDRQL